VRIGNHHIGKSDDPYIIAEIGVNHDGSESLGRKLIDHAASCGANAVKFQYFTAGRLLSHDAKLAEYQRKAGATDAFSMLQKLELALESLASLAKHVLKAGLDPIVTIFSVEHVAEMQSIPWGAFKIASPDIINRPLIESLCATGTPLIVSTGAALLEEVQQAALWIGDREFALMQCVSSYPTPAESAQLASIGVLKEICNAHVGYSDHTTDELTGALAVAAGAVLLEKHLTYDRAAKGPDHAMSLDPSAFRRYVECARRAGQMLGERNKTVQSVEWNVREVARQSIVTTRPLKPGAIIQRGDLTLKRPAGGLPPHCLAELIGRTIRVAIDADSPLTVDHFNLVEPREAANQRTQARAA
jgi:N-acetylneuraminate synthase/N,N'-diacetyllegionaminate synthase